MCGGRIVYVGVVIRTKDIDDIHHAHVTGDNEWRPSLVVSAFNTGTSTNKNMHRFRTMPPE